MNPSSGSPRRTARNLVPFVAASVLAWIAVPIGSSMDWGLYALAAGLAVLAGVLRIVPLRGVLAMAREAIPSLIFLVGDRAAARLGRGHQLGRGLAGAAAGVLHRALQQPCSAVHGPGRDGDACCSRRTC